MRVSRYRGEKNLKGLVGRLYRLGADSTTPAAAAAALVEANRHLPLRSRALARSVEAGTLIAVPELAGAFDGRSSSSVPSAAVGVLRAHATAVLVAVARDVEADAARSAEEASSIAALLESEDFRAAASDSKAIGSWAKEAKAGVDERRGRLETVQGAYRHALEDARQTIEGLAARMGAVGREAGTPDAVVEHRAADRPDGP